MRFFMLKASKSSMKKFETMAPTNSQICVGDYHPSGCYRLPSALMGSNGGWSGTAALDLGLDARPMLCADARSGLKFSPVH